VNKRDDAECRGKPTRPPCEQADVDADADAVVVLEPLAKRAKTNTSLEQVDVIELL
jgi:hypothetical protein